MRAYAKKARGLSWNERHRTSVNRGSARSTADVGEKIGRESTYIICSQLSRVIPLSRDVRWGSFVVAGGKSGPVGPVDMAGLRRIGGVLEGGGPDPSSYTLTETCDISNNATRGRRFIVILLSMGDSPGE